MRHIGVAAGGVWSSGERGARLIGRLIDAARRSRRRLRCRAGWWAAGPAFAIQSGTPPIALDVHLEDRGVMDEAVDGSKRHGRVGEDLAPFTERLGKRSVKAALCL